MTKPKILCYLRDTGPLGGIIFAAEGDPGAMAVVKVDGGLTVSARAEAAEKSNAKLREALEWYASDEAWDEGHRTLAGLLVSNTGGPTEELLEDGGERARAALSKPEGDGAIRQAIMESIKKDRKLRSSELDKYRSLAYAVIDWRHEWNEAPLDPEFVATLDALEKLLGDWTP